MNSSPDESVTVTHWPTNEPPVSLPKVYTVASMDASYPGNKWYVYYLMMNRVMRRDYNRWIEEIVQGPSTIVARVQ